MPTIQQMLQEAVGHHQAGRFPEAEALYRRVLSLEKDQPDALNLLGVILSQKRQFQEAEELLRKAIKRKPHEAVFRFNIGALYREMEDFHKAVPAARKAVELQPKLVDARVLLGMALEKTYDLDGALAVLREAVELAPESVPALLFLGTVQKSRGEVEEAIRCFRKALEIAPQNEGVHSSLIMTMLYHPAVTEGEIREELRRFNELHAAALMPAGDKVPRRREGVGRLRIGYVSPDFRDHAVGWNLLPLFENHDRSAFEIICYSSCRRPDALTERFRKCAEVFRTVGGMPDEPLADIIRRDQIDILVDLSVHTQDCRLLLFARKPAPVQVTFAGYPGSTGVEAVDFRLTDPHLDPRGRSDDAYSEESIRLGRTWWCYRPAHPEIPVTALPFEATQVITFACLNNFSKMNDETFRTWAEILRQVPESRLCLLSPEGSHRENVYRLMEMERLERERVEFVPIRARRMYLEYYNHIDISLDPWPYNGHTTALDSLWMGVPVVTLVGSTVVGRAGLSQLTNLGMPELIARTREEYVRIAVELASDPARLSSIRAALRKKMETSSLMDERGFARDIEAAFTEIWARP